MDIDFNASSNKIPYDDTPIFREPKRRKPVSGTKKIKIYTIILVLMFVLNVALCITCHVYLQNGKIKSVNIYNDTFSSQDAVYMTDSMRAAKYSAVCVAAGYRQTGVSLLPTATLTNEQFYNNTVSHGSGFLYKIEGETAYFVTCFHVINYEKNESLVPSTRVWVLPASMLVPLEVEVVAYSKKDDVAVLKYTHSDILATLEGCTPVSVYDSTFLTEYEDVFTIGNPLNHGLNGTSGKVTAFRQLVLISGMDKDLSWIKIDVAINPGNSGGGLFNANGQLVGMVNARIPTDTSNEPVSNIAFAIPGTLVCSIADYIIENNLSYSKPQMVDLGVNLDVDQVMGVERYKGKYKDQEGKFVDVDQQYVVIKSFSSANSIAKQQGLKVGDRLVSVELELYGNDETIVVPILNKFTFYEYAYAIKPGSFMKFTVQRQNASNQTVEEVITVRATNRA